MNVILKIGRLRSVLAGIAYSVVANLSAGTLDDAVDLSEDWKWISWFGSINTKNAPWMFHEKHGWLYFDQGDLNEGQFIHDLTLGWVWTRRGVYPNIYSFNRNTWMRFDLNSDEFRVFYDNRLGENLSFSNVLPTDRFDGFYTFNGFNLRNTSLDRFDIISGGPPRDGIPAILNPKFLPISEVDFMEEEDILLSITSGGETRGYPFRILNWHEIVNDQIGDDAFVVTYCPLCGTGVVFDAVINGSLRTFGVSGLLFANNVLMYDHQTESLWSQFMLRSVTGSMVDTQLQWRPSRQIAWKDWKEQYPDGKLLSTDTGFSRRYDVDPYASYFQSGGTIFRTVNPVRPDLPVKEWVWGITIGDIAKAYPLARLVDGETIRDIVGGVEIDLTYDADALSVFVVEAATGDPIGGGTGSFWFAWQDFFQDTLVYEP